MISKKIWLLILVPCLLVPALIITKKKSSCPKVIVEQPSTPALPATPAAQTTAPALPQAQVTETQKKQVKTDVPALQEQTEKQAQKRTIKIKSTINYDMLGYKHWGVWYHPSTFTLSINGTPFQHESEATVTVENNKLYATYHYEFLGGIRKGGRTLEFEIPDTAQNLTMSFDWKDKQHVLFNNAKWLGEVSDEKTSKKHKHSRKAA